MKEKVRKVFLGHFVFVVLIDLIGSHPKFLASAGPFGMLPYKNLILIKDFQTQPFQAGSKEYLPIFPHYVLILVAQKGRPFEGCG